MRSLASRLPLAFSIGLLVVACKAGTEDSGGSTPTGGGGSATNGGNGAGGENTGAGNEGGSEGVFVGGGTAVGGSNEGGGPPINPCGTECGPQEICDGINKGLDDDCDGEVDEDCPCSAGQASSCFMGDPSYLEAAGCNPGTMHCTELGTWGPCMGGNHATEMCFSADPLGCHPINVVPFGTADLTEGAGNFDDNADSGTYSVSCPPGIDPCPVPAGTDYTPLQSGEYTVTYTKTVDGVDETCTFPLYVGARGLRVELSWNFDAEVDVDLHMKQPMSTQPWSTGGSIYDCGYGNCKSYSFIGGGFNSPQWFPAGNVPPDPVNWFEDPVYELNSCYYAPQGAGQDWAAAGMGCHSPRLDLDNVYCTPGITDPQDFSFCAPENINIDFPPKDEWIRVGIHYYSNHGTSSPVYPNVKIFCDGALAADLGGAGYYVPEAPLTWAPSDGGDMWLVADVLFREDECVKECIVEPLYLAPGDQKLPILLDYAQYSSQNGPPYPPVPQ